MWFSTQNGQFMCFLPIFVLFRALFQDFIAPSKALKGHDPEGPEQSRGLKSALEGIFVPHIYEMTVF